MPRIRKTIPGVDPRLLIKDAAKLLPDPSRRLFLRGAAGVGAITMLTGCDIIDSNAADDALMMMSRFNDRVQALLFNPNTLAPTYAERDITRPFPFNAYYDQDDAPEVDGETYRLEVGGLVDEKKPWTLKELYALRRKNRSPATSASRAGARSVHGRARGCRISSSGSAPIRAPNTSGSSAPRAIPPPSTCRPRCTPRPR